MTPNQLIPTLEGLVGSGLRASRPGRAPQGVALWLECMKFIMRSSFLRDATDWNLVATNDAVNADTQLDSSGGTVYGVLVDSIFDVSGEDLIVIVADSGGSGTLDATSYDFGGAAGSPDDGLVVLKVESTLAAAGGNAWYGTWLDPMGQVFTNDIHVMADGEESTAPTSLDVRVWVVYRDTVETQVPTTQ